MSASQAFTIIPYGAHLQKFFVGDQNIVLGFNTEQEYINNPPYFGATIGRTANRISNAKINSLNGREYKLAVNNPPNNLHGGNKGWDKYIWDGPKEVIRPDGKKTAVYKLVSRDMDEGFPGEVEVTVAYTPYKAQEDGVEKEILEIEYEARLTDSQPDGVSETIINLTNHSYFNIGDTPTIDGTRVVLSSDKYLVVDNTSIPTGEVSKYPNITAKEPFILDPSEYKIDHCFIVNPDSSSIPLDTRNLPLNLVAYFAHPVTKIHLEIETTEPSFQVYTGDGIDVEARPDGSPARGPRAGFAVEPSRFVNAVNVEKWKNQVVIKKGDIFGSKIVYKGWKP